MERNPELLNIRVAVFTAGNAPDIEMVLSAKQPSNIACATVNWANSFEQVVSNESAPAKMLVPSTRLSILPLIAWIGEEFPRKGT